MASANPSKKTAKPKPCSHGLFVATCPLKTPARSKKRMTRIAPTRIAANRVHLALAQP